MDNNDTITVRIDRITKIPEEYLKTVLPAPKSVKIELSPVCNYRCSFCALAQRDSQPKMNECMELTFFKRIVKEMYDAGVEEIGLFYLGESLMNPDLTVAACKAAKEIGIPYVFLTTNGSRCTPKVARELFEAGLDSLKFSITSTRDRFKEITGVKEALFDASLRNLELAIQERDKGNFDCMISASSIRYDGKQGEEMQEIVDWILSIMTGPRDSHYWLPLYSMGDVASQAEQEIIGVSPTAGNMGRADNMVAPLPCWNVFTEGHIRANGDISFCGFDADGSFVAGNLHEQSFMEAWNSEEYQKYRKAHLKKDVSGTKCEGCIAWK